MDTLEEDLRAKARVLFRLGNTNHVLSYLLTALAALGSIIATLAVSLQWGDNSLRTVLAVLPAAALAIQKSFKFEEKSRWQWDKSYRVTDLLLQLHEGGDRKAIRVAYLKINTEALGFFPRFEVAREKPVSGKE
jgi:hypothetical protein